MLGHGSVGTWQCRDMAVGLIQGNMLNLMTIIPTLGNLPSSTSAAAGLSVHKSTTNIHGNRDGGNPAAAWGAVMRSPIMSRCICVCKCVCIWSEAEVTAVQSVSREKQGWVRYPPLPECKLGLLSLHKCLKCLQRGGCECVAERCLIASGPAGPTPRL